LPVAAGAGAALVLIYARLLGRVGWLIRHREPAEPPPEKDIEDRGSRIEDRDTSGGQKPEKRARKKARRRPKRAPKAQDPWAVPQEEPRREGPPVEPYGLADDDAPRQNPVPKKRGQGSGVRG